MSMMWLVSFSTEIAEIEIDTHVLLRAENGEMAEQGAQFMGKTWWPELLQERGGYWWRYARGVVRFNAITLLDSHESAVLQRLRFLDCWRVNGTPEAPIVTDQHDNHWLDSAR